jgi:hypothetical protein
VEFFVRGMEVVSDLLAWVSGAVIVMGAPFV